ncbi:MAG: hypothetical protein AB7O56_06170 [Bauldia sp.]
MNQPTRLGRLSIALAAILALAPIAAAQEFTEGHTSDGAGYSIPTRWVMGEPLVMKGTNWTDIPGTGGSTIAVAYDFGTVLSPLPLNGDDEVWAVIEAGADGSWSFGLPFPGSANWSAGETHKVHLLSGSLGTNDRARGVAVDVSIVAD